LNYFISLINYLFKLKSVIQQHLRHIPISSHRQRQMVLNKKFNKIDKWFWIRVQQDLAAPEFEILALHIWTFWKVKLITHFKEHFIIFYFGFHHQLNLVRELVLVSSDSNSLPITVVGIELWSSLPNSISITTEPPNDWCISLYFGFVKKCKFYFKVHHYLSEP
jgi:hypothetical protein